MPYISKDTAAGYCEVLNELASDVDLLVFSTPDKEARKKQEHEIQQKISHLRARLNALANATPPKRIVPSDRRGRVLWQGIR